MYDDYNETENDIWDDEPFTERMSLQDVIRVLQQEQDRPPGEDLLYGLSNLSDEDANALWPVWQKLGTDYKLILMQMLADAVESDFQLDYSSIAFWGMDDEDAEVRRAAIEALGEDESPEALERLLRIGRYDQAVNVRAEALGALGRFVLLGELGRLSASKAQEVQDYVLAAYSNAQEASLVRQRALESISNCTRDDITSLIQQAYAQDDLSWRRSALVAMGKTADETWTTIVLQELDSQDEDMRREAVRAAGELQLKPAVLRLAEILHEDERELREVAAWSLGEIGGKQALRALKQAAKRAERDEDDELLEIIEDAIGNASLMGGSWLA
ncbi:MAG: HEAT repeat domain-containing protein [Anaerolineae bacterium]|nr:HEAT repeat domain-containing protein [Anaerolineae bacterium]